MPPQHFLYFLIPHLENACPLSSSQLKQDSFGNLALLPCLVVCSPCMCPLFLFPDAVTFRSYWSKNNGPQRWWWWWWYYHHLIIWRFFLCWRHYQKPFLFHFIHCILIKSICTNNLKFQIVILVPWFCLCFFFPRATTFNSLAAYLHLYSFWRILCLYLYCCFLIFKCLILVMKLTLWYENLSLSSTSININYLFSFLNS